MSAEAVQNLEIARPPGGGSAVSEAEAVANRAARAFWSWSRTAPAERVEVLRAMGDGLRRARPALIEVAAEEVGAERGWIDFNIHIAEAILEQATTLPGLMEDDVVDHADGRRSIVRRQSAGVVLGFSAWNAPIALATRAIAAPVACGNTVVLKASEHCPRTHGLIVRTFAEAGLPADVVNVVENAPHDGLDVARALIRHEAVRRINFTGSTRVGRIIAEEAARELKRCLLELSGNAPLIVLDDADVEAAAAAALVGAFFNQGQVCMSTERIVVLDAVADAFVAALVARTRPLRAADPRFGAGHLGRLINADAAERVAGLISDAVANGAVLRHGGETNGSVMQPAVLDHVTSRMRIYHEESFGPVASIVRVRDAEEAISVANDTEFGLAAAIFGQDSDRAMRIADRLETGICQINGPTVFDDPTMPFGGVKASGYGRFGGRFALEEFTEVRWLSLHAPRDAEEIVRMLNLGRTEA